MVMKKIGDFLESFAKLAQSSDDAKGAVIEAITKSGIRVSPEIKNVTIRGEVATIKLSPIQKSEIALKQKKILDLLSQNPLTKNITLVR